MRAHTLTLTSHTRAHDKHTNTQPHTHTHIHTHTHTAAAAATAATAAAAVTRGKGTSSMNASRTNVLGINVDGNSPPPAVCALRNAGIAAECPSDVDPARLTTPKGNIGSVAENGPPDHHLRHDRTIDAIKQPYLQESEGEAGEERKREEEREER